MNHRIAGKQLGRNHHERQALIRSLVKSMFIHGSLQTTFAKVKSVRSTIEKLCTVARQSDLVATRTFFRYFQDRRYSLAVVKSIRQSFAAQTSNFTKVTKLSRRLGDQAVIVRLSFTQAYKLNLTTQTPTKEEPKK